MKIYIANDHAGVIHKQKLMDYLKKQGHGVVDLGTTQDVFVDYPDYAKKLTLEIMKNPRSKGILICGTGIGMSIAANKRKGIRAALCYDLKTAKLSREHNDANVLCLGARMTTVENTKRIAKKWLETSFTQKTRHKRRVKKLGGFK